MREIIQDSLPKPVDNPLEELDSLSFMAFVFKLEDKFDEQFGLNVNLLDGVQRFTSIDSIEEYLCELKESA
jgi:acyl carrier protein